MRRRNAVYCIALTLLSQNSLAETVTFGTGENEFEIEFVEIGDPGNLPDDSTFRGLGTVDYTYQIAKFEISRAMIEATELNIDMDDLELVGAVFPDMPATGITWAEASFFVNWLNSVHGYPDAYNLGGFALWPETSVGFDPKSPLRHRLARFALPTAHEWH